MSRSIVSLLHKHMFPAYKMENAARKNLYSVVYTVRNIHYLPRIVQRPMAHSSSEYIRQFLPGDLWAFYVSDDKLSLVHP